MRFFFLLSLFSPFLLLYPQGEVVPVPLPVANDQASDFSRELELTKMDIESLSGRIKAFRRKLDALAPKGDFRIDGSIRQRKLPLLGPGKEEVMGRSGRGSSEPSISRSKPSSSLPRKQKTVSANPLHPVGSSNDRGGGSSANKMGFYLLPFLALHRPADCKWHSQLGSFPVEQELGFASGWRVGKKWKRFFLDADFSYHRNELKALVGVPLTFSGEAEGFGMMVNAGGHFDLGPSASFLLGVGVGPHSQEIEFKLSGVAEEEEDVVLAYQIFTGVDFHPADHLLFSLKYRWLRLERMEKFSARSLHMLEAAFGYLF